MDVAEELKGFTNKVDRSTPLSPEDIDRLKFIYARLLPKGESEEEIHFRKVAKNIIESLLTITLALQGSENVDDLQEKLFVQMDHLNSLIS